MRDVINNICNFFLLSYNRIISNFLEYVQSLNEYHLHSLCSPELNIILSFSFGSK